MIESHGFCPLVFLWKALEGEGRFSSHSHSDGILRKLLEARVGIGRFSPRLPDKSAHLPEGININRLNPTKSFLPFM